MLRGLLDRLTRGSSDTPSVAFPDPAPERAIYAIGDIHGRRDLLDRLLDRIAADRASAGLDGALLVFLGDYVDRGEHSREVLERLKALCDHGAPGDAVCLLGNHEKMLLDFLDAPAERAGRWLRFGGLQTLASFSVGGVSETPAPDRAAEAAERLRDALGDDMEAWLRSCPLHVSSGNVSLVHAGADPALPVDGQSPRALVWGHGDFTRVPRSDGQWVVHGHTVVDAPTVEAGRINVDTGAWFSGRLSAARILPGDIRFLTC